MIARGQGRWMSEGWRREKKWIGVGKVKWIV